MKRNTKTMEQRIEEVRNQLNEAVQALADSEEWRAMLDYMASFHHYSLHNILLIKAQHPGATKVAGFRQWKQKGRQVRKGEQGIKIFGYSSKTVRVDDAGRVIEHPKGDEGEEKTLHFYPLLTVFDLSQTDHIEGSPEFDVTTPKLQGDDTNGIAGRLTAWLEGQGWKVVYAPIAGTVSGFTNGATRTVVIDSRDTKAEQASTLLHESAHVILHATVTAEQYQEHRGIAETEAESAAYVAGKLAGLDMSTTSIRYITGWEQAEPDTLTTAAENVRRAATQLINALGLEVK
jgi:antirestriction protein ArdC